MRLNSPPPEDARYYKFAWNSAEYVPPIGQLDYQPKGGAFHLPACGKFVPAHPQMSIPEVKVNKRLPAFGRCVYCGRTHDSAGSPLKLTSEHIVPEFLGAGIELPDSSCSECQMATSSFESAIARDMFDPVRKHLAIPTKGLKEMRKGNFPVDVGRETTEKRVLPIADYPTIITLPRLCPAPAYSDVPLGTNGLYDFLMYNLNVDAASLARNGIAGFCTQSVDLVRFCQMLAKIAHVATAIDFGLGSFHSFLTEFIKTDVPTGAKYATHFDNVGSIWQPREPSSSNLHEVQTGYFTWRGATAVGARVRLFAKYGFPSYHIAVGSPVDPSPRGARESNQ